MLDIPDEQIFILYEYENLKEELTYKDVLFNMVYDIKQYLGIIIKLDDIKDIINQDILNIYLKHLSKFLDPITNELSDILLNTKELYNKYINRYITNIPNKVNYEYNMASLDMFLNSLLEIEYFRNEYYSFN